MKRETSDGKCSFCEGTFSKQAMARHLEACEQRKVTMQQVGGRGARKRQMLHLVVEGQYLLYYWMHLEAPADATLSDLDDFLRYTWLECCGHLSAFTIDEGRFAFSPMEEFDEKGLKVPLGEVLNTGTEFYHEYDFGTTTHLRLRVKSAREGKTRGKSIQILARNEPPPITCQSCGKAATCVCAQCIYEGEGWLCDKCASDHECGEDMFLPVVNSPRVGMCGYTGPSQMGWGPDIG